MAVAVMRLMILMIATRKLSSLAWEPEDIKFTNPKYSANVGDARIFLILYMKYSL
jgi:hypothetical protein